jgi:hypothetical protein
MNAIHRTRVDARRVFGVYARLCNYVGHKIVVLLKSMQPFYYHRGGEPHILARNRGCGTGFRGLPILQTC